MVSKLGKPITFETASAEYFADCIVGEGGAGRVYGARGPDGADVAVKVLTAADRDKRRRFKNEINFGLRNEHANVVTVIDFGLLTINNSTSPFYVMRRYGGNLRTLIREKGIRPENTLSYFSQILDGVEAAHLKGVVHRDLKPENILCDMKSNVLAVGDFGIARFAEDLLATAIKTDDSKRLANFLYAAPEQRVLAPDVGAAADIYALGLMLNEMFTGAVPLGNGYATVASVSNEFGFLDPIIAQMLRHAPGERPKTVADIKMLIMKHRAEAVSLQKVSEISKAVIKVGEVDDPLAFEPPQLIGANWENGTLILTLDKPVSQRWVQALRSMGNYTSVMGKGPEMFNFRDNTARVSCAGPEPRQAQNIIDYFKQWLPVATRILKDQLEQEAQQRAAALRNQLQAQKNAEEERLRINRGLRI